MRLIFFALIIVSPPLFVHGSCPDFSSNPEDLLRKNYFNNNWVKSKQQFKQIIQNETIPLSKQEFILNWDNENWYQIYKLRTEKINNERLYCTYTLTTKPRHHGPLFRNFHRDFIINKELSAQITLENDIPPLFYFAWMSIINNNIMMHKEEIPSFLHYLFPKDQFYEN